MSDIIAHIVSTATTVCGVTDIKDRNRYVRQVRARRLVCVYLTKHLHMIQREVAEVIDRDRSTVADLVMNHDAMIRSDAAYRSAWEEFSRMIGKRS